MVGGLTFAPLRSGSYVARLAITSTWSSGLTFAATAAIGIFTLNPVPAVTGAIGFTGWLFERWQEANREPSPAKRPSATVPELVNSVSRSERRPGWFQEAATEQAPTRSSDEKIVGKRAAEIARSGRAGTDFDNWIRAVIEPKIEQRAAEIARSPNAGSDFDNWIRAERELAAEHATISQRAEKIARSAETAIEIRTHVEIMLRAEEIAKSPGAGSDWENWLRAERELAAKRAAGRPRAGQESKAYRARLDERVQRIAASPEAALGHWLRAEQELRVEGRIAAWPR
jgi:hypothetical protein